MERNNDNNDNNLVDYEEESVQEVRDEHSKITFRIPENFYVDKERGEVFRHTKDGLKRISPNLIWPIGIIKNLDEDTEKIKILMEKRGEVKEGVFYKSIVYGSPMELANFGIPINTTKPINIKYIIPTM